MSIIDKTNIQLSAHGTKQCFSVNVTTMGTEKKVKLLKEIKTSGVGKECRTTNVAWSRSPTWNESFFISWDPEVISSCTEEKYLLFRVFTRNQLKSDSFYGQALMPLSLDGMQGFEYWRHEHERFRLLKLQKRSPKSNICGTSSVSVVLSFISRSNDEYMSLIREINVHADEQASEIMTCSRNRPVQLEINLQDMDRFGALPVHIEEIVFEGRIVFINHAYKSK